MRTLGHTTDRYVAIGGRARFGRRERAAGAGRASADCRETARVG